MARPQVFTSPTTLYHPVEGARVFPAGETDPGLAWSDSPGGDRSENSMPSVLTDLIAANDRADALGVKLDKMAADMDRTAAEATEAKEALGAAEQAAIAAKEAQTVAETASASYMEERDAARSDLISANEGLAKMAGDRDAAQAEAAKVAGLVADLETANQTIADLNGKVADLEKDLETATAPAPKKTKGVETNAAPEPAAGDATDRV